MPLANTATSYGSLARAFHWLIALLVLSALALGLYAKGQPQGSDAEVARLGLIYSVHKSVGLATFAVALARILWAFGQPRPAPIHADRGWRPSSPPSSTGRCTARWSSCRFRAG
jgi:cytochrome b561